MVNDDGCEKTGTYLGFVFVKRHVESKSGRRGREISRRQWRKPRCFTFFLDICESGGLHVSRDRYGSCWRRDGSRRRLMQRWRRLWRCAGSHRTRRRQLGTLLVLAAVSTHHIHCQCQLQNNNLQNFYTIRKYCKLIAPFLWRIQLIWWIPIGISAAQKLRAITVEIANEWPTVSLTEWQVSKSK